MYANMNIAKIWHASTPKQSPPMHRQTSKQIDTRSRVHASAQMHTDRHRRTNKQYTEYRHVSTTNACAHT